MKKKTGKREKKIIIIRIRKIIGKQIEVQQLLLNFEIGNEFKV
jgi:hypothetical protein